MTRSRTSLYTPLPSLPPTPFFSPPNSYRIGDAFISLPLPEVQELLAASTEKIEQEVTGKEERLESVREEMRSLKVELYARFGRSINLET